MTSGTGTCTVNYNQAGDANYNSAPQVTETVTAQKASQTITVNTHAPPSAAFNTSFGVAASAPGGIVSFSSSGACSNTGNTFTMTSGTGTCSVNYDQAGNGDYNPAPQVTETVNAQKANQAINVTTHAPASASFDQQFTVAATGGGSGNPVTFSSSGACTNVGAAFTITSGIGTCSVNYDQAGNANYNAAPQVTETVSIGKIDQAINVTIHAPASAVYNTQFSVAATGGGSGNSVTFSSSGACTNAGATFTMTSGTGTCTVKYDQAGDSNYNPAPQVTETVNAQKAGQTITVSTHAPSNAAYNTSFGVQGNAPGGVVTFSSSGTCTNSGNTFTMTSGSGTCTVNYDQAGNTNYDPAPQVTESVSAQKANQTITFGALAAKTFGDADFAANASASSGLAVSFAATGNCTISGRRCTSPAPARARSRRHRRGTPTSTPRPMSLNRSRSGRRARRSPSRRSRTRPWGARLHRARDRVFGLDGVVRRERQLLGERHDRAPDARRDGHADCLAAGERGPQRREQRRAYVQSFAAALFGPERRRKEALLAAKTSITKKHCRTGQVRYTHSTKVAKGRVVSQSRRAGRVLAPDAKINIVVSRGRSSRGT